MAVMSREFFIIAHFYLRMCQKSTTFAAKIYHYGREFIYDSVGGDSAGSGVAGRLLRILLEADEIRA